LSIYSFDLFLQGAFFFLLQSEDGDLYKVTIEHEDEEVRSLKIKYFDTVPVASSLCILKSGFLFAASEFGNQFVHPNSRSSAV
jgi:splicing factor 3B subunit 3